MAPLAMTSNEHPSPQDPSSPKTGVLEETLKVEKLQIERKTFVFTLKENPRGRFVRITEDVSGRRDTIIVPAPGLEDFGRVIGEMARVATETPSKTW
jgi:hypothetical protein